MSDRSFSNITALKFPTMMYFHEFECTCICNRLTPASANAPIFISNRPTVLSLHDTCTATKASESQLAGLIPHDAPAEITQWRTTVLLSSRATERGGGWLWWRRWFGHWEISVTWRMFTRSYKNLLRSRRHQTSPRSARMADGELLRKHPHHQSQWNGRYPWFLRKSALEGSVPHLKILWKKITNTRVGPNPSIFNALTIAFVMQRVGYEVSLQCICLEFLVLLSRNRNVSVFTTLLPTSSPADSAIATTEAYITPHTVGTGLSLPCWHVSFRCCQLSCHSCIHLTIIFKYVAVKIFSSTMETDDNRSATSSPIINIIGVASVDTKSAIRTSFSDRPPEIKVISTLMPQSSFLFMTIITTNEHLVSTLC